MPSTFLAGAAEVVDVVEVEHEEVVVVAVVEEVVVELEEADAAEAADAVEVEHEEVVVVEVVEDGNHATAMDLSAMVCPTTDGAPLTSLLA